MAHKQKRVLITGMSGLIGQVVRNRLESSYALNALNRQPVSGIPTTQANIADFQAIRAAFEGVDTVVHLAAVARANVPWEEIHPTNIVGTYNVFEAARQARRFTRDLCQQWRHDLGVGARGTLQGPG